MSTGIQGAVAQAPAVIPPRQVVRNIPDTGNISLRRSTRVNEHQHGNLY